MKIRIFCIPTCKIDCEKLLFSSLRNVLTNSFFGKDGIEASFIGLGTFKLSRLFRVVNSI